MGTVRSMRDPCPFLGRRCCSSTSSGSSCSAPPSSSCERSCCTRPTSCETLSSRPPPVRWRVCSARSSSSSSSAPALLSSPGSSSTRSSVTCSRKPTCSSGCPCTRYLFLEFRKRDLAGRTELCDLWRLLRMLDKLNFKGFVSFLLAFSPRTSLQQKIEFIFRVYDTDYNGKVAFDDISSILQDLMGSFMTEQQREELHQPQP